MPDPNVKPETEELSLDAFDIDATEPVKVETETAETETKSETKSETKVETKVETKPEVKTEIETDGESGSPTTETDTETEFDATPIFTLLNERLGWETEEDKLPKDRSIEGVIHYMEDIVKQSVEEEIEEKLSIGNGEVKRFFEYVKAGGDPKEYFNASADITDVTSLDLTQESNQKLVIEQYEKVLGTEQADIEEKIKDAEESGILEKEAKRTHKKLVKLYEEEQQNLVEQKKKEDETKKQQLKEYWDSVENTINTAEQIGPFKPTAKERKDFLTYLTIRGKDGYTQYEKDLKEDATAAIKMAFSQFKKFDLTQVKTEAKTEAVKQLRKNLQRHSSRTVKDGKTVISEPEQNLDAFKLDF